MLAFALPLFWVATYAAGAPKEPPLPEFVCSAECWAADFRSGAISYLGPARDWATVPPGALLRQVRERLCPAPAFLAHSRVMSARSGSTEGESSVDAHAYAHTYTYAWGTAFSEDHSLELRFDEPTPANSCHRVEEEPRENGAIDAPPAQGGHVGG